MKRLLPLAALLALSCGSQPVEGSWTIAAGGILEDSCAGSLNASFDTTDALLERTDDGFSLRLGVSEAIFDCAVSGRDFLCDSIPSGDDGSGFTGSLTFSGTFSDDRSATGKITFAVDCQGDLCADLEDDLGFTYPCSVDLAATYQKR